MSDVTWSAVLRLARRVLLAMPAVALAPAAMAQVQGQALPPGGTAGTIEQEVRPGQPGGAFALTPEELRLTGQNDLLVLAPQTVLELSANAGYRMTTNAFLGPHDTADQIFTLTGAVRFATQLAEKYDVYAELDVFSNRYVQNTILNYDGFTGQFGGALPLGNGFKLDLGYDGTIAETAGFGHHLLTIHDLNVAVERPIALAPDLQITPTAGLTRSYAQPSDFDSWSLRGALPLTKVPSATLTLYAVPSVTYRDYDRFFPGTFNTSRLDTILDATFGLGWTPLPYLSVLAQVDFTFDSSSLSAFTYGAISATPSLRLSARF